MLEDFISCQQVQRAFAGKMANFTVIIYFAVGNQLHQTNYIDQTNRDCCFSVNLIPASQECP